MIEPWNTQMKLRIFLRYYQLSCSNSWITREAIRLWDWLPKFMASLTTSENGKELLQKKNSDTEKTLLPSENASIFIDSRSSVLGCVP